ncbi:MAG: SEC-C metal-binding domain-containing protein, partial [Clostridiales bacterium]|nr:SEC-C metal-binding domain-containing protein [Clostridiales bacterium]
ISNQLISGTCVYACSQPLDTRDPDANMGRHALWDTGANCTVIKRGLAEELGLKPVSIVPVTTPQGTYDANRFYVDIYLPNRVFVPRLLVLEGQSNNCNWDVLIGMDIICRGDFSVTNYKGKTTFSFRMPSAGEIDFVKNNHFAPETVPKFPGRNDPCPCGSGKKYKHCHGNEIPN